MEEKELLEKISDLKKIIEILESDLATIDGRIDVLECYNRKTNELDELYDESNRVYYDIEKSREQLKQLEEQLCDKKR